MKYFFQNHQKKSSVRIAVAKISKNFSLPIHLCPEVLKTVFPVPMIPLAVVQLPDQASVQALEVAAEKLKGRKKKKPSHKKNPDAPIKPVRPDVLLYL